MHGGAAGASAGGASPPELAEKLAEQCARKEKSTARDCRGGLQVHRVGVLEDVIGGEHDRRAAAADFECRPPSSSRGAEAPRS